MNRWNLSFFVLFASVMCGCSAVYSTKPVGERPYIIKAEEWDGTWINKNSCFSLKVIDGRNGIIKGAWIEWKDNEAKLESHEVKLLRSGESVFANVKADNMSGEVVYLWALIKREGNEIVCWTPEVEKIENLCKTGKLPCKKEDDDFILKDLTSEHLKIITSGMEGSLYDFHNPFVFTRILEEGG